jgi:hypothetical protein
VNVADSTLLAEKRGALWALAHPLDGGAVPPAVEAADDFRAYVSTWHGPYEGRDYGDAPFQGGCPAHLKAPAKKALDMLRAQPEAFGWLDLAWVSTLGYSRAYNFGSLANFCAQAEQLKDLMDGFAHCVDGGDPLNSDDVIAGYLAQAKKNGAPIAACTNAQARCFRQGVPYLDVRISSTSASASATTPDEARAQLAAWRASPPAYTPQLSAEYDRLRRLGGKSAPDAVLAKVFPQAAQALHPAAAPARAAMPPRASSPAAGDGPWSPGSSGTIAAVPVVVDARGNAHPAAAAGAVASSSGPSSAPPPAAPAAAVTSPPGTPDDPDLSGGSFLGFLRVPPSHRGAL